MKDRPAREASADGGPVYDVDSHRDWLLSLLDLPPGGAILDVGCGKGADLPALAGRIPDRRSRFVGVDASADHLAAAHASSEDHRVEFVQAKVGPGLGFGDETFDVLLTQELLECLPDLDSFVPELARVLRPGGQIVASHYDWDTQIFNGSDRERTRRILRAWAESEQSWMDHIDPWMGRRLWGYLEGSGLFEGEVRVRVMTNTEFAEPWHGYRMAHWFGGLVKRGTISESEYAGFLADLEDLAANRRYFWSVNRYVYVGRRTAL
jgi:ubiquinone/menaquinone biosynthesis C-methylase UbiE